MAFTETFGGTTIYPSDVSYRAISLSANQELSWPLEVATSGNVVAQIMDVTPSASGFTITMPPANEASPGETALFFNAGSFNFTVADNAGNTIVTITPGLAYQVYLTTNTTVAGTWRTTQFGAGTSSATAGSLVGAGIKAINTTLNQSMAVTSLSVNYTAGAADRSAAFLWTGGAGTITLPAASTVGNDWFFHIRNGGTGAISLATTGGELINGTATVDFNPGDSAIIVCDGTGYFTIGFGQAPEFLFDYVSIDLTSQSSPYTLAGSNLNRIAYQFSGTLTTNMEIIVPATIQQYWVGNFTTGGSYTVTVKTSAGTGVIVPRDARAILYCNGTDVVTADTGGISIPILVSQGGTGATNASQARTNLGATSIGNALFIAADEATARNAIIAAKSGANSDITSLSGLTTPLSVAQGGTGVATFTANGLVYGAGTSSLSVTAAGTTGQVLVGNTGSAPSWATLSGIGVTTFSAGTTGLTPSSATSGAITLAGTLIVANGGTGATTLTGYVKGSGTSALTASATIPATDISGGAALTKTDDTNVTLTLGGTPASALLAATSLTLGWSGQLSVARGGTGASTLTANGVLYGSGTSAIAATAVGATGEVLVGNTGAAPSWATLTGIGVTSFSGGTTGLTPNTATTGAITLAGTLGVANGGTGVTTSTGTGSVVLSNSPTFVTPTLGAASATSIANGLGAAGTPSYTFTGDLNTGMWSPAADTIAFSANGTERMRLSTAGNLGVNVTPSVWSGFTAVEMSTYGAVASSSGTMDVINNAFNNGSWVYKNTNFASLFRQEAGAFKFFTAPSGTAATAVSFTERMRLTEAGDVGIGTSSPANKLDVAGVIRSVSATFGNSDVIAETTASTGTGYSRFILKTTDREWRLINDASTSGSPFLLYDATAAATRLLVDSSGNVGIGTTGPSSYGKLAVIGNIATSTDGGTVLTMRANAGATTVAAYNATGSFLSFNTNASGSGEVERMRITSAGDVGIGTTSYGGKLTIIPAANPTTASASTNQIALGEASNNTAYRMNIGYIFTGGYASSIQSIAGGVPAYLLLNADGGSVGIGTYTPTLAKLQVVSAGAGAAEVVASNTVGVERIHLISRNTAGNSYIQSQNSTCLVGTYDNYSMQFLTNNTERMRIDTSGNVGIGTSSPSTILHVNAGAAADTNVRLQAGAAGNHAKHTYSNSSNTVIWTSGYQSSTGNFGINAGDSFNATGITINTSGNVGIGTTTPDVFARGYSGRILGISSAGQSAIELNSATGNGAYFDFGVNGTRTASIYSDASSTDFSALGARILSLGTSGAAALVLNTNNTEKMRITSAGDVGIGTSSPQALLTISSGSGTKAVWATTRSFTVNRNFEIAVDQYNEGQFTITPSTTIGGSTYTTPVMAINASSGAAPGFVGIGTTAPSALLDVVGGDLRVQRTYSSSNTPLSVLNSAVTSKRQTYDTAILQADDAPTLRITEVNSTTSAVIGEVTLSAGDGGVQVIGSTGPQVFATGRAAGEQGYTTAGERMRLTAAGELLVGTTTAQTGVAGDAVGITLYGATSTGAAVFTRDSVNSVLYVNNKTSGGQLVQFYNGGNQVGSITSNGTTTAYVTTSDERLKHDIVDAPEASSLIDAIQVRSFKWNSDSSEQRYGMVAQELLEVAPEAVSQPADPEEMMGVDYSKLVPMLVKEIQSLRARVAQLEGN
jgi:hypothetical protein